MLVDAAAHDHVVEALAVHLFRLDLARHRIGELVFLPERRLLLRQLNPLFDEQLAVDVLQLDQVAPDLLLVEAVREYGPVQAVHDQVQVAVDELTLLVGDLGVPLIPAVTLDVGNALLDHGDRLVLGGEFGHGQSRDLGRRATTASTPPAQRINCFIVFSFTGSRIVPPRNVGGLAHVCIISRASVADRARKRPKAGPLLAQETPGRAVNAESMGPRAARGLRGGPQVWAGPTSSSAWSEAARPPGCAAGTRAIRSLPLPIRSRAGSCPARSTCSSAAVPARAALRWHRPGRLEIACRAGCRTDRRRRRRHVAPGNRRRRRRRPGRRNTPTGRRAPRSGFPGSARPPAPFRGRSRPRPARVSGAARVDGSRFRYLAGSCVPSAAANRRPAARRASIRESGWPRRPRTGSRGSPRTG